MAVKNSKPMRATPIKTIPSPAKPVATNGSPQRVRPLAPARTLGKQTANAIAKVRSMSDEKNDPTIESLDKVRDILFGQQVREQEKRFGRLEDRLAKELNDIRDDLTKRMGTLEAFAKSEIDTLTDRLKAEQTERTKSDRELTKELEETGKSLEKKLSDLDGRTTDATREIRKLILDQSKILRDEMLKRNDELSATLQKAIGEIRNDKADRFGLADLLTEVAMKLKGEFKMPKGG